MKAARPSATARVIAAATVLLSHDPAQARLVPPAAAQWCARLLATSWRDRLLLASVRWGAGRLFWRALERFTLPGIVRHYAVRKAFIEATWRDARASGYSQLLVLAGGLDTLALRVAAADPAARVVELDHPATQAIKRRVLSHDDRVPLHLVAARLDGSAWPQVLLEAGALDTDRPTLAVVEGFSMYLDAGDVAALLRALAALDVPRLRLVLTLFHTAGREQAGFHPRSRLIAAWLRRVGEPFRWVCREDTLADFMLAAGFRLSRLAEASALHAAAGATGGPVLRGEGVAVAERVAAPARGARRAQLG